MLDADRQANHVFGDARFREFLGRELSMRGRRRVSGERARITDVHKTNHELQRIEEFFACCPAAFHAEGENARGATSHVLAHQSMVGMIR